MTHELPYSGLAYEIGSYDPDELNFESASGSVASFDNGADDVPLKSLKLNIVPKQSGSGDPSPSNVRPITGWDEVEVVRTGVNVWDEEIENGYIDPSTGEPKSSNYYIRSKNFSRCLPNTIYYLSCSSNMDPMVICWYDADGNFIGVSSTNTVKNKPFTSPNGAYLFKVYFDPQYYNHDISINYPSTDTSYHSYQGTSYPISLPSTVYGGELDVVSGSGKSTMGMVDLGSLTWSYNATYGIFIAVFPSDSQPPISIGRDATCEKYSAQLGAMLSNLVDGKFMLNSTQISSNSRLAIKDSSYTDATTFKDAVNGTKFVYELAEPIDFNTTPVEITTLLGNNNIYSSCGDVEVEFIPMVEKNTFPYSGEKYYVGIFEETEPVGMVRPIDITPISIDEPIISPIDLNEPIDFNPLPIDEPIVEPIEVIEEEETDTEESETDGECESELND